MYKDIEKRREANRRAQLKFKQKQGITKKVLPKEGITSEKVLPEVGITDRVLPKNYGLPNCECVHCQQNRRMGGKFVLNHGRYMTDDELVEKFRETGQRWINRVSLPGDVDYVGICPIRSTCAI